MIRFCGRITQAVMLFSVLIVLAACGGAGASPADVTKSFYEAAFSDKADVAAYVCKSNQTMGMRMLSDMEQFKSQMNIVKVDLSSLKFETVSQAGDNASVKVSGKLKGTVGAQPLDIDYSATTVTLKNESGWKVCG
jgi:hypothetical protein